MTTTIPTKNAFIKLDVVASHLIKPIDESQQICERLLKEVWEGAEFTEALWNRYEWLVKWYEEMYPALDFAEAETI